MESTTELLSEIWQQTETDVGQGNGKDGGDVIEQNALDIVADRCNVEDERGDGIDRVGEVRAEVEGSHGEQLNGHLAELSLVDCLPMASLLGHEPNEKSNAEHGNEKDRDGFVSERFVGHYHSRRVEAGVATECSGVVEVVLAREEEHGVDEEAKCVGQQAHQWSVVKQNATSPRSEPMRVEHQDVA